MTGTAIVPDKLRDVLESKAESYASLLPVGYGASRLITGALVAVQQNPALAKCEPKSIATALARIAQWGLDVGDTAHLVPYGTNCQAIVDFKGLIKLMVDAGARKVEAYEVYEGDVFEWERGTNARILHKPTADRSRKIVAAYAIVTLSFGVQQFEVMTAEEIDEIRQNHSKQWKSGPLTYWYSRKTVLRRLSKYVRRNARLEAALSMDGERPEGVTTDGEIVDAQFEVGDASEPDA